MKILIEGGGFPAFWYNYGYGYKLLKNIKTETDYRPNMLVGYSAGALVSTILIFDEIEIDDVIQITNNIFNDYSNRIIGFGFLERTITNMFNEILPNDAHIRTNNKLGIILCDPNNDNKCRLETEWTSKEELIQCLVSSCYIPFFTGCGRLTDEYYNCRDAIFSSNLESLKDDFDIIIKKSQEDIRYGFLRIHNIYKNLQIPSYENAMTNLRDGVKDSKKSFVNKKYKKFIFNLKLKHIYRIYNYQNKKQDDRI